MRRGAGTLERTTLTEIRDHNLLRGQCRENEWEEERMRVGNCRENVNGWWVWQPAKDLCLKLWRGFFQEEREWRGGECEDHEEEHEEGCEEHEGHKKREEGHKEREECEERGT